MRSGGSPKILKKINIPPILFGPLEYFYHTYNLIQWNLSKPEANSITVIYDDKEPKKNKNINTKYM